MRNYIAIIPARLNSTRLPRKPILKIDNKYLIQHVFENVSKSKYLKKIIIATDSEEIRSVCHTFNAPCILTNPELPSGTDRIYQAYIQSNETADIIINIQGDEPFISATLIDDFIVFLENSNFDVGTIIKKIQDKNELFNPSVVKVVINSKNYALYFSRSPIPFVRDISNDEWLDYTKFYKHIGIYAYTVDALQKFVSLNQSILEKIEKLEQLRLLENDAKYLCYETSQYLLSIDTPDDLETAHRYIQTQK
ncbi:MAG: 3-deoxy-manno-octulosonate cytidylyltransferase [Candidatus Kapaibacteriota bacterium]